MDKKHRIDIMQELLMQGFTPKGLLEELMRAMSHKEAVENFEYICRMHDIEGVIEDE